MKAIELINLYRLKDMTRTEIRKDNWFVLETNYENIPEELKNKEVCDFCFSDDDKLVVNFSSDEVEIIEEDKEIEEIEFDEIDELTNYDIYFYPECSDDSKENFKDKINELIRNQKKIIKAVNELRKGK